VSASDSREERIAEARKRVVEASQSTEEGQLKQDAYKVQDLTENPPITEEPTSRDKMPENQSFDGDTSAEQYDLSERDREAIRRYTGAEYAELNWSLWSGHLNNVESVSPFSHDLSSALEKLPRYEGTVLRGSMPGISANDYQLERYEPGETVVENGYLSCTTDPEMEFDGEVLWIIESKSGRDIGSFSRRKPECEILFDRFSRFEIRTRENVSDLDGRERWLIYMEEV
jgi:hypothetical protein